MSLVDKLRNRCVLGIDYDDDDIDDIIVDNDDNDENDDDNGDQIMAMMMTIVVPGNCAIVSNGHCPASYPGPGPRITGPPNTNCMKVGSRALAIGTNSTKLSIRQMNFSFCTTIFDNFNKYVQFAQVGNVIDWTV